MIKVIDAICGAGKSTYIIDKMRDEPDRKYLYITPFLTEVEERIPNELPELNFKTPKHLGKGKLSNFKDLVERDENIASTHSLFSMFTPEIVDLIVKHKYCLIIDEAIDCFGLLPDSFKPSDTMALIKGDFVNVDESNRNRLVWNEDKYPEHDGRYSEIRNMCNLEMMYCYVDTFLMWEYPPKLLKGLDDIYVLTYLFDGSDMRCWLELNNIDYDYVDNQSIGLRPEEDIKNTVKDNLTILCNRTLENTRQQNNTLSKSWFEKANAESIKKYKSILRSTVVTNKAKKGDVFWTTYKSYANKLAGDGYRFGVKDCDNKKEGRAFLPCNIRATNDFKDYWLCMYAMNRFKNPVEVNYMKANGVRVEEDIYVLSEMIQFIFRGCIREGKPMKLLILSDRMRRILEEWLNGV